jgi:predicted protein tyrosine phosphatase
MPSLHVCPLSRIEETIARTGARSLVTLMNPDFAIARPAAIAPERHHHVAIADITAPLDGYVMPEAVHVDEFLAFVRGWDRREPMLIHCFAGISRSTAAAYIAACALYPHRSEEQIARALRLASPTATPNALLVRHADALLAREGRMIAAIEAIGRGAECAEGEPFTLLID